MSLYENIHKKRKSGRKMRKKGAKGAPSAQDFANAARTARKMQTGGVFMPGMTTVQSKGCGAIPKNRKKKTKLSQEKTMAKKLSPKQKKIARVAKPRNKITGADFQKLRRRKKK